MYLSALDPSLLVYEEEDWHNRAVHFSSRIKALTMHRQMVSQYNQQFAITNEIAATVQECFPWGEQFKNTSELHDLRQFILLELSKARYVCSTRIAADLSLQAGHETCEHVANTSVFEFWKELLYACVEEESRSECDIQVASWSSGTPPRFSHSLTLCVNDNEDSTHYSLPLVCDEQSWNNCLQSQDSWPDLQRCVDLYFKANVAMQSHPDVRGQPIPFECTDGFWKSVDKYCEPNMRQRLVKAVAKRVYGLLDHTLRDEPLETKRRFRVNKFWRVHYIYVDDSIVLEEFGEHDMGL